MEYLLLIFEFFYTKGWRGLIWHILIPVALGFLIYFFCDYPVYIKYASIFHSNVNTVLGILIGFTMSVFMMLLTIDNENITQAKAKLINKRLYKKDLSIYDSVLVGLAYLILILGFLLIANFIYPIFISVESYRGKFMFSINIAIVVHAILILMRNILDFYFILTKKEIKN